MPLRAVSIERVAGTFEWIAGATCLDFTNTVTWRMDGLRNERLATFDDLVVWSVAAGLLTREGARTLRIHAQSHPRVAAAALLEAHATRLRLHQIFTHVAMHRASPAREIAQFNRALARTSASAHLVPHGRGFRWRFARNAEDLGQLVRPVTIDAAHLLASDDLTLVQTCANDNCGWLFVNRSRNGLRRWCDMRTCGNKAKARRYYHRARRATR
jgi:predicted RNA-binding Zn ribbon-like protein